MRQSIAAAIAGLALSHTIAQAMLNDIVSSKLAFFRTHKQVSHHGLLRAIGDAREESLLMLVLSLCAGVILLTQGDDLPDARIWSIVLLLQTVPYASAMLLSVISAFPRLPAALVGEMGELRYRDPRNTKSSASLVEDPELTRILHQNDEKPR